MSDTRTISFESLLNKSNRSKGGKKSYTILKQAGTVCSGTDFSKCRAVFVFVCWAGVNTERERQADKWADTVDKHTY